MNRGWVIWHLSWRSIVRGLLYGVFCGILFAVFVMTLFFLTGDLSFFAIPQVWEAIFAVGMYGGVLGGIIGLSVGVVLAFLLCTITLFAFYPLHDSTHYLKSAQRWSTIIGGLASLLIAWLLFFTISSVNIGDFRTFSIFCLLPALFASAALWRNSYEVAHWYIRTTEAHATLEQNIAKQFSSIPQDNQ